MDTSNPRFSGWIICSAGLEGRGEARRADPPHSPQRSQVPQLRGYYSKAARACTWPCLITQMDEKDEMERIYEALVFWADVVTVATPIRWAPPPRSISGWLSGSTACRTRSRSRTASHPQ
jgi:hypothetical protein